MGIINNFSEIFLSVWNKGILGVDIFQILIGIGIFLIFLVFRGLISKLIIKKPKTIGKNLAGPSKALTNVSSSLLVVLLDIISNFFMMSLLIKPLNIKNIKNIPIPINIWKISTPRIPLFQTDKNISEKLFIISISKFYITKTLHLQN